MEWPEIQLDESMSIEQATTAVESAFEAQDIYLHPHSMFNPLGELGKMFSRHDEGRNDALIIHAGAWSPSDAAKLAAYAKGLLEKDNPFGEVSVAILATHSLPDSLQQYQYPAKTD
ncbi:MAG: hypothetical protein AAFU85_18650 [Planctomycetota bacterium]